MKKKLNIFLIVVVLMLWGTVAYRYISNSFSPNHSQEKSLEATGNHIQIEVERDTFLLSKLSYDPFAQKGNNQVNTHPALTYKAGIVRQKAKKETLPLVQLDPVIPEISYYGYIKSENKELAILSLNGKIKRLAKGEEYEGLVVKNFTKTNLTISCKRKDLIFDKIKND